MKHYRQIIIDLAVEDETPEQEIEELKDQVKAYVAGTVNPVKAEVVAVKVN